MKIVINDCYGGFSVSKAVYDRLGIEWDGYGFLRDWVDDDEVRTHPDLIAAVEELGEAANGSSAQLNIIEIPDDCTCWYIDDYDGIETVRECHRSWS